MSAAAWHASLAPSEPRGAGPDQCYRALRVTASPPDMQQPALLDDVICLHLGGPKQVVRSFAGKTVRHDVPADALTIMPRWQENRWRTEGPVDYIHLIVSPRRLDEITTAEFARARDQFELRDDVGFTHPLVERLGGELVSLQEGGGEGGRLYREGVFTAFVLALLRTRSSLAPMAQRAAAPDRGGGLAAWKLKRVLDYLRAHRAEDIGYDALTRLAGVSRSHLFRAFKNSTGMSPGRYLEQIRIAHARGAIEQGTSIDEAAGVGGFDNTSRMSRAFVRAFGVTPTEYRRWYR